MKCSHGLMVLGGFAVGLLCSTGAPLLVLAIAGGLLGVAAAELDFNKR